MLIYAAHISPRLRYVCRFIFDEQFGLQYDITDQVETFTDYKGEKIWYDAEPIQSCLNVYASGFLSQSSIEQVKINGGGSGHTTMLFMNEKGDEYDLFSMVFFLLSRYEEYLVNKKDTYGRFPHTESLAYKQSFLHLPLLDIRLNEFEQKLKTFFEGIKITRPVFQFIPSYDIDQAYAFKLKPLWRNLAGFFKQPNFSRITVPLFGAKDPFDSYDFLHEQHKKYQLKPIYFFLVAAQRSKYDKNHSPQSHAMQTLIKDHARQYRIGLHPSWNSNDSAEILLEEKESLEKISEQAIVQSRAHYIKISLPETYRKYIECGIQEDYSMGYGSINGFRASTAASFYWYDVAAEKETNLRLYPFCFMDANSYFEQRQSAGLSYDELMHYYQQCKTYNGYFIPIFHNSFLGSFYNGWQKMYKKFLKQIHL